MTRPFEWEIAARESLFDNLNDPAETDNLADKHSRNVHEMTSRLPTWQRSVDRTLTEIEYKVH